MLREKLFLPIGGLIALAFAMLPAFAEANVPSNQVPSELKSAIEQYIENQGHGYAGLCVDVNQQQPLPFGEYCAFVLSIEHDIADVSYAPVASDDISYAYFKNTNGTWSPILPDSETPTPPPAENNLPAGLANAIKQHIESRGHQYAGLCVDVNANPPLPFGKYCAFVLSIEHDIAEISYGPVASNDITMVSFELVNGTWQVMNATSTPTPTTVPPTSTPTSQPTTQPTSQPTVTVPPALLQAIKQHIESQGKQYAGLCVDVNQQQPLPFGKYCAFVLSINGNVAEVSYGPVASNAITRVTFELENGQWKLPTASPTPTKTRPAPLPPSTGSGSADSGTSGEMVLLAAVTGLLALSAGAVAVALRRR